jgi:hypothetical protein
MGEITTASQYEKLIVAYGQPDTCEQIAGASQSHIVIKASSLEKGTFFVGMDLDYEAK